MGTDVINFVAGDGSCVICLISEINEVLWEKKGHSSVTDRQKLFFVFFFSKTNFILKA